MRRGERVFFISMGVLSILALMSVGWRSIGNNKPREARDYYEWHGDARKGYELYKQKGCNSCHRVLRMGEAGVAPVLDGEGTRRTEQWLKEYFRNPEKLVPGSAHTGRLGPDFRQLSEQERAYFVDFLKGLKSNPGSSNYPVPPEALGEAKDDHDIDQINSSDGGGR